jgi:uncharacterized delta-60 repeat protein
MGTTGDDKILLGGSDAAQGGLALMRLNANGTLDTTFGNNGQVITPIPTTNSGNFSGESATCIAVTSSGQILVLGNDIVAGADDTVLLARYNPNGTLDTTFGNGGTATTNLTTSAGAVLSLALQPDGKFVVAGHENVTTGGSTTEEGMLLRYNANGSLDTSFGNGGIVNTASPLVPPSGYSTPMLFTGVAVYPSVGTANDGKIVAAGYVSVNIIGGANTENEWVVARYNPDGGLDTTFGNGAGCEVISDPKFATPDDYANAVAIESDGKPIIAGSATSKSGGPTYSQVARLNVNGSLDTTFGNGGLIDSAIGNPSIGPDGAFEDVALQPDGKILAAGYAELGGGKTVFSLARYLASQPQIGSFTANPNPVNSGSSVTLTASNISDGNPNVSITQVAFYLDSNNDGKLETSTDTLLGYATQSSPGVWTLTNSSAFGLTAGTYTLFAQAQDSDGVFGDPIALTLTVQ